MNEAELLLTEILHCDRPYLYLNKDVRLSPEQGDLLSKALLRRSNGEPLQYILGKHEFMGLEFDVNNNVLIPRPETEILVEETLKIIAGRGLQGNRPQVTGRSTKINILDIGTGSGCIAISLAKLLGGARITALDISKDALNVAVMNAAKNGVAEKINFIKRDVLSPEPMPDVCYDVIVSNPPYIPTAEILTLAPEVRSEPSIALDGGADGLDFYKSIIGRFSAYLIEGGFLIMEMGFGQKENIENIFQNSGEFNIIDIIKDYSSIERVIIAQRIKNG